MARTNNLTDFLTDISSAIKQKTGDDTPIPASEFDTEILSIETAGNYQEKTLDITQNGNYNLLPDQEFDAISNVNISVSVSPVLQNKTITENGSYTADQNYDGLGTVIVNVPSGGEINNQDKTITENGTYTADEGYTGLGIVTVNVPQTGDVPVKLFATEEEMQADTTAKEGDLAVVYRDEIQNIKDGDVITSMTFPKTVVFDTAIATSYSSMLENSIEPLIHLDMSLSSTSFRIKDMYGTIPTITYTSSDGITYTRTDTNEDTYEVGETTVSSVDEHICKFIQVGGSTFEGLYEYKLNIADETVLWFASINDISFDYTNNTISNVECSNPYFRGISKDKIVNVLTNIKSNANVNSNLIGVAVKDDGKLIVLAAYNSDDSSYKDYGLSYIGYNTSKNYIGLVSDWNKSSTEIHYWEIDEETFKPVSIEPIVLNAELDVIKNYAGFSLKLQTVPRVYSFNSHTFTDSPCLVCGDSTNNTKCYIDSVVGNDFIYKKYDKYIIAPTQLSVTSDYVYEKEFYGKNGVETGTLTQDVSDSFTDINAEVYGKIQNAYNNMEPRVLTNSDKTIDTNIYIIPVKSDGTVLLDTSNVTTMSSMFNNCTNLTIIPLLDTSNVTAMNGMFQNCTNLIIIPLLDTSNATNMAGMFYNCTNLTEIPQLNTSSVTSMINMFAYCTNLTEIPLLDTSSVTSMGSMFYNCTNLTEIPLLDTSSVTSMNSMFYDCPNLTEIPLLDTSSVTNIGSMFTNCTNLSDESLNNILAMCANATSYTSTKTLVYIGLSEEQATKCTTLSNYSAFTAAGWTTGY